MHPHTQNPVTLLVARSLAMGSLQCLPDRRHIKHHGHDGSERAVMAPQSSISIFH